MRQQLRQDGAWSIDGEAAYSIVDWDEASGDADITEFDCDDRVIRRFEWRRQNAGALLIEFAPGGEERSRQLLIGKDSRGW